MRKGHIMRKQIRRHIYFSGRVQEVGFRFTACLLARRLGLTGWVKNLWDGRVEMEVQGTEDEIRRLIQGDLVKNGYCMKGEKDGKMDCCRKRNLPEVQGG